MTAGVIVAVLTAALILVARAVRRVTVRPAVGGLVGVVISSTIAARTGDARAYFLPDIWGYAIGAVVLATSILLRRPLAGVLWSALNRTPMTWRSDRRAVIGYSVATATAVAAFAVRAASQIWFYQHDQVGVMALLRVALNYPLWGIIALTWAWAIRNAGRTS